MPIMNNDRLITGLSAPHLIMTSVGRRRPHLGPMHAHANRAQSSQIDENSDKTGRTVAGARRAHARGAAEVGDVERECAGPVVDRHCDDVNAKVAGRLRFELGVTPGPGPHPVVANGDGHCGLPGGHVAQQRGGELEHLGVEAVCGVLEQPSSVHDVVVHVPVLVPVHIKDARQSESATNEIDLSPKYPRKCWMNHLKSSKTSRDATILD